MTEVERFRRFRAMCKAGKSIKRAAELAGIKPRRAYKPPAWLEVA